MEKKPVNTGTLKQLITDEIFKALHFPEVGLVRKTFAPFFSKAAERFAELGAGFDLQVARHGFTAAARWVLPRFVSALEVHGDQNIPDSGPLLIASNHPGTYDSLVISANVTRPDFKIVAGAIPFLQHLPNISQHMIYTPSFDPHGRMNVVREAIRHLKEGGCLLIFARGTLEPDPAVMPNAKDELKHWSRSLEIFLKHVPQSRILVSIVSGVLAARSVHHPITWLCKERVDRQRLAMFIQVIQQMLFGNKFSLTPRLTFDDITGNIGVRDKGDIFPKIVEAAQRLLALHLKDQTINHPQPLSTPF